jgi:hypothetical protein
MNVSDAALLLAWVAIVLLTLGFAGMLNHVHALTVRARGGGDEGERWSPEAVVGFRGPASSAVVAIASSMSAGAVAVFVSPTCATCHRVTRHLADAGIPQRLADVDAGLVFVSTGSCRSFDDAVVGALCLEKAGEEHARLGVPASPWVVVLAGDGTVLDSSVASGPEVLDRAVSLLTAELSPGDHPSAGERITLSTVGSNE